MHWPACIAEAAPRVRAPRPHSDAAPAQQNLQRKLGHGGQVGSQKVLWETADNGTGGRRSDAHKLEASVHIPARLTKRLLQFHGVVTPPPPACGHLRIARAVRGARDLRVEG